MQNELAISEKQPTVMEILSNAVLSGNISVDVIERLTKLQREQVEYQAMVEFNEAMHRCQLKMQPIRAEVDGDKGKYANYAQIDRVMRPIYTSEGISLSFSDAEPLGDGWLRLVCYVARGGYVREYRKDMPLVTTGAKGNAVMTPIHAQGSSDQYAKRYLISDIFNIAIDKSKDDDGRAAGGGELDQRTRADLFDAIEAAQTVGEVTANYIKALQTLTEIGAKDPGFKQAANKRKTELQRGN
jgi:hypothetical protein